MNNEEFINEINSDFNRIKSLSEQLSTEIFSLTSKYCMADENLYYVLVNGRKSVEHLYGSLSIAQNAGVANATYLKNGPYQQYYQGGYQGSINANYSNAQQHFHSSNQSVNNIKPIIFSRQRSSSSQSHLRERWEDITPTPINEFSMSVPNSVVGCEHDHSGELQHDNIIDEPMNINEVSVNTTQTNNTQTDKKAFADIVKQPVKKTNNQENSESHQTETQKSDTLPKIKQTIKPFIKQNESGVWNLQTKPGMILEYIHNNIDELQFEVANIDELMNIKFYFRNASEINMHGLWQYNRKYFLSEDGRVFIYTKKRELVQLKQGGKEITYKLA